MSEEKNILAQSTVNIEETINPSSKTLSKNTNVSMLSRDIDDVRKKLEALTQDWDNVVSAHTQNLFDSVKAFQNELSILKKLPNEVSENVAVNVLSLLKQSIFQEFEQNIKLCEQKISSISNELEASFIKLRSFESNIIKRSIKRTCMILGLSLVTSLSVSYFMMKQFPQRISVDARGDITVKDSQVHLWEKSGLKKKIN